MKNEKIKFEVCLLPLTSNLWYSHQLPKNIDIKIYCTIILFVVLCGCKT